MKLRRSRGVKMVKNTAKKKTVKKVTKKAIKKPKSIKPIKAKNVKVKTKNAKSAKKAKSTKTKSHQYCECGAIIPKLRLQAIPGCTLCVKCASEGPQEYSTIDDMGYSPEDLSDILTDSSD